MIPKILMLLFKHRRIWACLLVVMAGVSAAGCVKKADLVVWREKVVSPNGSWIASAETVQNGGFGSGYIETSVYLKRKNDRQSPYFILGFSSVGPVPHPYVLDNAANAGGTINLKMSWLGPLHLLVTYSGNPHINLETVKLQDVTISIKHLSNRSVSAGRRWPAADRTGWRAGHRGLPKFRS